jgi:hypothetical protein
MRRKPDQSTKLSAAALTDVPEFPDEQTVSALRRQLSRTHFKHLSYLEDPLKRFLRSDVPGGRLAHPDSGEKIDSMIFELARLAGRYVLDNHLPRA